ncbi:MAG: hypothetical protein HUU47_09550 [Bacteroidetes bacterium]|nr:hypothetical protein [Bacteroidota bacterium]
MFIFFGICMLIIGIPMLFASDKGSIPPILTILFLLSGSLMIVGGYQTNKKNKEKEKALNDYQQSIAEQLSGAEKKKTIIVKENKTIDSKLEHTEPNAENYKPDIIANWHYTIPEWKKMTKEERVRRTKEGIWLSIFIGAAGTLVLMWSRDANLGIALFISFFIGILISVLKIVISSNEMKMTKNNNIIFTTNALIINGKFKTINDVDVNLEYLKFVKHELGNFIEFSLQWATRRGPTNDQFRILIPEKYKDEAKQIFEYYKAKGVRVEEF